MRPPRTGEVLGTPGAFSVLTRCPQCETLYPLTTAQLKTAEGRVRCSRCRTVFYALEHLYQEQTNDESAGAPPELQNSIRLTDQSLLAPNEDAPPPGAEALPLALRPRPRPRDALAGWLLATLLALGVLGQGLWWQREPLLAYPQARQVLESLCAPLDCRLPQRRALDKIRILSREMTSHPERPGSLLFLLVMANQAEFPQPYPLLQLELFRKEQELAGSRILAPAEYLPREPAAAPEAEPAPVSLMPPDHPVYLRLELMDPGPDTTGFEIRFL